MPRIVPRGESGLARPRKPMETFRLPARELWCHHSVTPVSGDAYADWRTVQQVAFGRGFADISYNFGLHPLLPDVLEGRLLDRVGAHTEGHNSIAFGVVLVGNYEERTPNRAQVDAFRWLRHTLVARGLLTANHKVGYHAQTKATACPGRNTVALWAQFTAPTAAADQKAKAHMVMVQRPGRPEVWLCWKPGEFKGVPSPTARDALAVPLGLPIVNAEVADMFGIP